MNETGHIDPAAGRQIACQARIDRFRDQCGGAPLLLAAHAAVLETMRPETIALLRRNFLSGSLKIRADLDADVLYGSLSTDLGGGYFRMDNEVRRQLVIALDAHGGRIGLTEYLSAQVARFVRLYARQARESHVMADDPRFLTYLDEIEWVALGYDEPDKAARSLGELRDEALAADRRRVNLGRPAALLSLPLNAFPTALRGIQALDTAIWLKSQGRNDDADRILAPFHGISAGLGPYDDKSFDDVIQTFSQASAITSAMPARSAAAAEESQSVDSPKTDVMEESGGAEIQSYQDSALHAAIRNDDAGGLAAAIAADPKKLEAFGLEGRTPLTLAVELGRTDAVRALLAAGADVNATDATGGFALFSAIEKDDQAVFDLLLDAGADPLAASRKKRNTGLTACIFYRRIRMFHRLLQRGADVNHVNSEGLLPTDYAALRGNREIWDGLRARNATLHIGPRDAAPLVNFAASGGDPDILLQVIEAGAEIDSQDATGWRGVASASFHGHPRVLVLLLELGANPDSTLVDGWTPLMIAAWKNRPEAVRLLLSYGANPDIVKRDGYSALLLACWHGNAPVVAELLKSPDVTPRHLPLERKSPLLLAVNAGSLETVEALLADPRVERNHYSEAGASPPLWAAYAKTDNPEILTALLSDRWVNASIRVDGETLLHKAIADQRPDVARALIRAGADLAAVDGKGQSLALVAVAQDLPEILNELLASGAPVEAPAGHPAMSPLTRAVASDKPMLLRILREHGADLSLRDEAGRTLLHLAGPETADALIQAGLDPNARDDEGMTPLMEAARLDRDAVVARLSTVGDLSATTIAGWTALHFAVQTGSVKTVDPLLASGADPQSVAVEPPYAPLQVAAEIGASDICKRLCDQGADVDFHTTRSPPGLILAVQNGQLWTALDLLRMGANRHLHDPLDGRSTLTVLHARQAREAKAGTDQAALFPILINIIVGRRSPDDPLPEDLKRPGKAEQTAEAENEDEAKAATKSLDAAPAVAAKQTSVLADGVFLADLFPPGPDDPVSPPWQRLVESERRSFLERVRPAHGRYDLPDGRTQILSMSLPFYEAPARLIRIRDLDWAPGRRALFYLLREGQIFTLNGASPPIHEFNKLAPVKINEHNVTDYCRFFGFFVRGEEGPFHVLETADDPTLNADLGQATRDAIAGTVRPASFEGLDGQGNYLVDATVAYSTATFIANFQIEPSGMMTMLDDEPIAADLGKLIDAPLT